MTVKKRSYDLYMIVTKVFRMGEEPIINLPDELMTMDVSSYLPLARLTQIIADYEPVQPTTHAQQVAITTFVEKADG